MRLHVYSIPMTTRFRRTTVREGVLIEGPAGWAEFSPFADYDAAECAPWWRAAVESAQEPWPKPRRERIAVNCTIPAVGPVAAGAVVARSQGCTTAKVKVAEPGQSLDEDADRVAAVRDALGPGGRIRVDANAAWTVDEAVTALTRLNRVAGGLEYAEQPCAEVSELAQVRRRTGVPIAADESIRRSDDPRAVVRADAADVAVVKVQPLGGIRAGLQLIEQVGLPVVVSSALETSIGLSAGVALAATLPELPFACGLATASLLSDDVTDDPVVVTDGQVSVGRRVISEDRLARIAADEETERRWHERLADVRQMAER